MTPHTNMGASAEGAEITTFLAPPFKCAPALPDVTVSTTHSVYDWYSLVHSGENTLNSSDSE